MNWGHKIAMVYGGFALFVIGLVVFCMRQTDIHLVSKEYYKEEIAYQNQIDQLQNAQRRQTRLQFNYEPKAQAVNVVLPTPSVDVKGEVIFFRPSDARQDWRIPLQLHEGTQSIPVGSLTKGPWKVKIHWLEGGKEFLEEQVLILQ